VEIGCPGEGFSLRFTSSASVRLFLPQDPSSGSVNVLTQDHNDSQSSEAGQCGGELLALALSIRFSTCIEGFSTCSGLFQELYVCDNRIPAKRHAAGQFQGCIAFYNWTVIEIFNEAQRVVGGCDNGTFTINQTNDCLALLNQEFANGRGIQGGDVFSLTACPELVPVTVAVEGASQTSMATSNAVTAQVTAEVTLPDTSVIASSSPSTVNVGTIGAEGSLGQDLQTTDECLTCSTASILYVGFLMLISLVVA
jgi:hypothetical protein